MVNMPFTPGWTPERNVAARASLLASGRRFTTVSDAANAAPRPKAYSLTGFRRRKLEQGQAGTCWLTSVTRKAETMLVASGLVWFPVCRRLIGYVGKQLEGGGNPTNGGSPTDALAALTADKGAGLAHEDLLPYSDDSRILGTKPPQSVFDDAKACHLAYIIDVKSDEDAKTLIAANKGVCNGVWWPYNFDDRQTFMTHIGSGEFGHSLFECGYAEAGVFDEYDWIQWDNWHGELYPPLPPEKAALVPNYAPTSPDKTTDFWVRGDLARKLYAMNDAERVSATDIDGGVRLLTLADAFSD